MQEKKKYLTQSLILSCFLCMSHKYHIYRFILGIIIFLLLSLFIVLFNIIWLHISYLMTINWIFNNFKQRTNCVVLSFLVHPYPFALLLWKCLFFTFLCAFLCQTWFKTTFFDAPDVAPPFPTRGWLRRGEPGAFWGLGVFGCHTAG